METTVKYNYGIRVHLISQSVIHFAFTFEIVCIYNECFVLFIPMDVYEILFYLFSMPVR